VLDIYEHTTYKLNKEPYSSFNTEKFRLTIITYQIYSEIGR